MKLAFVVQRYGLDINGGAELHCRWVAEHMKKYCDVEVLTTRAFDYITWKDYFPQGEEYINGVLVKRFSVNRPRNPERFGKLQDFIVEDEHKEMDELRWLEEEGPLSSSLIHYIKEHESNYDYFVFFSYRYYHSYWGIHAVPHKSILVPTAEHDDVIHLKLFKELFRKPQAFVFNSFEEREMIRSLSQNGNVMGDVVGVGTEVPKAFKTEEFRKKHGIPGPYVIYVGRIDENKGCDELFDFFLRLKKESDTDVKLVLVGSSKLKIPSHPDIIYLGFTSEEEKFSALNGAEFLLMPSFFESLSMVTIEAWAMGKPVLANARCTVLKGQCVRSNAGFFYENYSEFRLAFHLLLSSERLREIMGANGLEYFNENYTWEVIENKYLSLLDRLQERTA
ncbi:MAG: glycosyltransferase family 4 protein [Candidatus Aminicenantes bacterium]|nr:glycosyltransferase family 4 protein [Candidatus Aminicenantes bacterium]